ncbi:hypothetical protein O181_123748, partial [Austropuccinia psidii MF-1]|nr:hypothetical protein [Austropuccinia psidii MF-1]
MRFLDIESGKVVISQEFVIPLSFRPRKVNKPTETLPSEANSPNHRHIHLPSPQLTQSVRSKPYDTTEAANKGNTEQTTGIKRQSTNGWDYVLHYDTAPQDI